MTTLFIFLFSWTKFFFWAGVVLVTLGLVIMILALLLFAGLKELNRREYEALYDDDDDDE